MYIIANWIERRASDMTKEQKDGLLLEVEKLHKRHVLAENVGLDYYEPGMMEYLAQSDGSFNEATGEMVMYFESKGTRYEGRTEQIEKVKCGDEVCVIRDEKNPFNRNNFLLLTRKGRDIGCMPAELCNALAPLYDEGNLIVETASVSFVEPISKRSRYAKQAVLFVELRATIRA